ncbi:MAG: VOC family protein [Clostridia bacterium]
MDMAKNATGIQHLGIPTGDIQATIAFYEALGFVISWRTAPDSKDNVAFLKLHNLVIEAYESETCAGKAGAIDHVAIDVQDIEAAFAFCQAADFTMLDQQINFLPFLANGVRFFTILGPSREKVEFNQAL